jgi:hypothetical protein
MQIPTEGRIVNFVTPDGQKIQPAIIVNAWERRPDNYLNLIVFRDGGNDDRHDNGGDGNHHTSWQTSVAFDAEGKQGRSWHWPQKTPPAGFPPVPENETKDENTANPEDQTQPAPAAEQENKPDGETSPEPASQDEAEKAAA